MLVDTQRCKYTKTTIHLFKISGIILNVNPKQCQSSVIIPVFIMMINHSSVCGFSALIRLFTALHCEDICTLIDRNVTGHSQIDLFIIFYNNYNNVIIYYLKCNFNLWSVSCPQNIYMQYHSHTLDWYCIYIMYIYLYIHCYSMSDPFSHIWYLIWNISNSLCNSCSELHMLSVSINRLV